MKTAKRNEHSEMSAELLDAECFYPENRVGQCTAPSNYRCPYRKPSKMVASRQEEIIAIVDSGLGYSRPFRLSTDPKPVLRR